MWVAFLALFHRKTHGETETRETQRKRTTRLYPLTHYKAYGVSRSGRICVGAVAGSSTLPPPSALHELAGPGTGGQTVYPRTRKHVQLGEEKTIRAEQLTKAVHAVGLGGRRVSSLS